MKDIFWQGPVPKRDDFGLPISVEFIDGRTANGPWAIMTPTSWSMYGCGQLGTGGGQRYKIIGIDRWRKVEG